MAENREKQQISIINNDGNNNDNNANPATTAKLYRK